MLPVRLMNNGSSRLVAGGEEASDVRATEDFGLSPLDGADEHEAD